MRCARSCAEASCTRLRPISARIMPRIRSRSSRACSSSAWARATSPEKSLLTINGIEAVTPNTVPPNEGACSAFRPSVTSRVRRLCASALAVDSASIRARAAAASARRSSALSTCASISCGPGDASRVESSAGKSSAAFSAAGLPSRPSTAARAICACARASSAERASLSARLASTRRRDTSTAAMSPALSLSSPACTRRRYSAAFCRAMSTRCCAAASWKYASASAARCCRVTSARSSRAAVSALRARVVRRSRLPPRSKSCSMWTMLSACGKP